MKLQASGTLGTLILAALLTACAATSAKTSKTNEPDQPALAQPSPPSNLYPSTYSVPQSAPTLIRNATVLTGTGTRLDNADVLIVEGKIQAVGQNLHSRPKAGSSTAKATG